MPGTFLCPKARLSAVALSWAGETVRVPSYSLCRLRVAAEHDTGHLGPADKAISGTGAKSDRTGTFIYTPSFYSIFFFPLTHYSREHTVSTHPCGGAWEQAMPLCSLTANPERFTELSDPFFMTGEWERGRPVRLCTATAPCSVRIFRCNAIRVIREGAEISTIRQ